MYENDSKSVMKRKIVVGSIYFIYLPEKKGIIFFDSFFGSNHISRLHLV